MSRKYIYVALILLTLISLTGYVEAHEWYPYHCCSNQDCHPIASCAELLKTATGYDWISPSGVTVHFENHMVDMSKDAQCHVCTHEGPVNTVTPYCAFIQLGS